MDPTLLPIPLTVFFIYLQLASMIPLVLAATVKVIFLNFVIITFYSVQVIKLKNFFLFPYIFLGIFCVYVPLLPLRGQHTVLCHPRWLPTSGLTEFAVCWGGAGFEPRTTDLQSGALPLSHLSSNWRNWFYISH